MKLYHKSWFGTLNLCLGNTKAFLSCLCVGGASRSCSYVLPTTTGPGETVDQQIYFSNSFMRSLDRRLLAGISRHWFCAVYFVPVFIDYFDTVLYFKLNKAFAVQG